MFGIHLFFDDAWHTYWPCAIRKRLYISLFVKLIINRWCGCRHPLVSWPKVITIVRKDFAGFQFFQRYKVLLIKQVLRLPFYMEIVKLVSWVIGYQWMIKFRKQSNVNLQRWMQIFSQKDIVSVLGKNWTTYANDAAIAAITTTNSFVLCKLG
jgi:hypothetical protein